MLVMLAPFAALFENRLSALLENCLSALFENCLSALFIDIFEHKLRHGLQLLPKGSWTRARERSLHKATSFFSMAKIVDKTCIAETGLESEP